eukprot:scaffold3697_cov20-Tisochrysis_lutea.AAC.1
MAAPHDAWLRRMMHGCAAGCMAAPQDAWLRHRMHGCAAGCMAVQGVCRDDDDLNKCDYLPWLQGYSAYQDKASGKFGLQRPKPPSAAEAAQQQQVCGCGCLGACYVGRPPTQDFLTSGFIICKKDNGADDHQQIC